ncbi:MAG: cyclic pyranopterin monophosphate synthase MoaC [Clostridiales bacterium]|jgi:cyclic pyranopterin phosphate synthase|nr:cyclic pyranopterin monophosphate synthase MoaC [Eubacteriales bacterium]MDH7566470.1 cyclic pyranopterin monophosphate synthase MoaC [Clostridiales bacterium]
MELTHIDERGNARMVDVSGKAHTEREAVAVGCVSMKHETLRRIVEGNMPKGDVLPTARIAGIMAAKRTHDLIPMCHNIPLDWVKVDLCADTGGGCIKITSRVKCTWKTGVEMEALVAVSAAALTVYDMCKAVDKDMVIGDIKLVSKTGGKSGNYTRTGFEKP